MIAKVVKAEVIGAKPMPTLYNWEFMLAAKADPDEIESGRCTGTDVNSVAQRLQSAFAEYKLVDLKMLGPCEERANEPDGYADAIFIDEHALNTTIDDKKPTKQEPGDDNGLIVLPLDAFEPIELEA